MKTNSFIKEMKNLFYILFIIIIFTLCLTVVYLGKIYSFNGNAKYLLFYFGDSSNPERNRPLPGILGKPLQNENWWPFFLKPSRYSVLRKLDFKFYSAQEEEGIKSRLQLMIARSEKVSDICLLRETLHDKSNSWKTFTWFVDHSPPVVYCPIQKVGSTTMKSYFLYAINYWPNHPQFQRLTERDKKFLRFEQMFGWGQRTADAQLSMPYDAAKRAKIFQNSIRVMVVRHPFSRILSGYNYRLGRKSNGEPKGYYKTRQKIISEVRTNLSDNSLIPTFEEVIDYIIVHEPKISSPERFLGILEKQSKMCEVCLMDPIIVIKLESLKDDMKFLGNLAQINEWKKELVFPAHIQHPTNKGKNQDLFRSLPQEKIDKLYQIYWDDFKMFNYTVEEFYSNDVER